MGNSSFPDLDIATYPPTSVLFTKEKILCFDLWMSCFQFVLIMKRFIVVCQLCVSCITHCCPHTQGAQSSYVISRHGIFLADFLSSRQRFTKHEAVEVCRWSIVQVKVSGVSKSTSWTGFSPKGELDFLIFFLYS